MTSPFRSRRLAEFSEGGGDEGFQGGGAGGLRFRDGFLGGAAVEAQAEEGFHGAGVKGNGVGGLGGWNFFAEFKDDPLRCFLADARDSAERGGVLGGNGGQESIPWEDRNDGHGGFGTHTVHGKKELKIIQVGFFQEPVQPDIPLRDVHIYMESNFRSQTANSLGVLGGNVDPEAHAGTVDDDGGRILFQELASQVAQHSGRLGEKLVGDVSVGGDILDVLQGFEFHDEFQGAFGVVPNDRDLDGGEE